MRAGGGSHVEVVSGAKGASAGYFRILKDTLRFAAYLDAASPNLANVGGTVFAVDPYRIPSLLSLQLEPGAYASSRSGRGNR